MRLEGKVAIVSGAGSIRPGMGNGKAAAILLAREGASVVAADRDLAAAEETAGLISAEGGKVVPVQADVATEDNARRMVEAAVETFGGLDILFNNVGIASGGTGLKVTEQEWDTVMGTNLKSVLFACKYAAPEMAKRGGGAIVNNSSMAAYHSHGIYAYSASKAGVIALTHCLAMGLAKDNIRVNCVAPGLMDTPLVAPIMNERRTRMVEARVPLRRHGTAWETAATVLFLASAESSYITGQTIPIDGGLSVS